MRFKNQLKILNPPIKHCKTCFKPFKTDSFYELLNGDSLMCKSCQEQFNPRFINFEIEGVKGLSIYEYDDNIKNLLYLFKGCYDVELANVFLYRFKKELNILYKGYVLVPASSYHDDDEKRGFKHVVKMFEIINLPFEESIKKISPFKQAKHNKRDRKSVV